MKAVRKADVMTKVVAFNNLELVRKGMEPGKANLAQVVFSRVELEAILQVYSRLVMAGECRDYSLVFEPDWALFLIFRRACEGAFISVKKNSGNITNPGLYSVITKQGQVLRHGSELKRVLAVILTNRLQII